MPIIQALRSSRWRGVGRILVIDASIAIDLIARFRPEPIEEQLRAPGSRLGAPVAFHRLRHNAVVMHSCSFLRPVAVAR